MIRILSTLLKRLETGTGHLVDGLVYILLFFFNPGHKYNEIRQGYLGQKRSCYEFPQGPLDETDADLLLSEAIRIVEREEARKQTIDDKSKVLLTVSALLIAGISASSKYIEPRWPIVLPMLPALFSVVLVLVYFRIQTVAIINLNELNWKEKSSAIKLSLAREHVKCANHLSPRNDFQAGIYRAAARALLLSMILFVPIFVIASFSQSDDGKMLKMIRTNSEIRKELMGPSGPMGPVGPPGARGERGPTAKIIPPTFKVRCLPSHHCTVPQQNE